ncbi:MULTISPECIES: hypothetical protein [Rhodomicrobium]|uniref:hypothetical protein n=1 Tax=Rhodomicrobium TaxID=1068 RepID=UPI000B4B6AD7|nr:MULTISPECIES: hypothetical protein [Rhodomicrobium]
MKIRLVAAFAIGSILTAFPALAQNKDDDDKPAARHSMSGLLTGRKNLDPLTLSSGKPLAKGPYELEAGKYYRLSVVADGTAELALSGSDFFRNIWINEIVINKIEVRPMGGIESIEFDDEGTATISFVTIRPGTFHLRIPNTTGDSQQAIFIVK